MLEGETRKGGGWGKTVTKEKEKTQEEALEEAPWVAELQNGEKGEAKNRGRDGDFWGLREKAKEKQQGCGCKKN